MRIFISSTCYDLIDLRAEIEEFFRAAGLTPVLSDSLTSDFEVSPSVNSIETCLANVRNCDAFIIILSNRYGPKLDLVKSENLSATHLEYREAVKTKKPIYMYVRDRLVADFEIWRKNREHEKLKLSWCKEKRDWEIFSLLTEHKTLTDNAATTNWFWQFRHSIELKQRLMRDFKHTIDRVTAQNLFNSGRVPLIEITPFCRSSGPNGLQLEITLRNLSPVAAIAPTMKLEQNNIFPVKSLKGGEDIVVEVRWERIGWKTTIGVNLTYQIVEGHQFNDEGQVLLVPRENGLPKATYEASKRKYIGSVATLRLQ